MEHQPDNLTNTDYWRGRIDTRLDQIEHSLNNLSTQLERVQNCVEKRTRMLYLYAGGLVVVGAVFQIAGPAVIKALLK